MTVQEVFDSPAVKSIEIEILDVMSEDQRFWGTTQGKVAIQHLLSLRRNILAKMFVLTDEYKTLLEEFNEKLIEALSEMRWQTINMHDGALNADMYGVETIGKVFMSYKYPENHPIQTVRAKKIWAVLNGSYDNFMPLYEDGADNLKLSGDDCDIPSENQILYLSEDIDNWNEGLDPELTKDLHLISQFHKLFQHMAFAITDIIYVRKFKTEINVEITK